MTSPNLDPVLESVNLAASLVPNYPHGNLVKSWLKGSIVDGLTPASGNTPESKQVIRGWRSKTKGSKAGGCRSGKF